MNAVIYFSASGRSRAVAQKLAAELGYALTELTPDGIDRAAACDYDTAVVVFPVHCQSYPKFLKKFLKRLKAERVAIVATYGGTHTGNAVYEAAKIMNKTVIAAAYLPCNHSYVTRDCGECVVPKELIEKIDDPSPVTVKRRKKTPFAALLPSVRSRAIIKIIRTQKCAGCNKCASVCPMGAIEHGVTDSKCIRCLKCVYSCPDGALKIRRSRVLERYLSRVKCDQTILYI